jgi:hypothetical protein
VIVPARDERTALPATIAALARQVDLRGRPLDPRRYEVIVLANNCRDDTVMVARAAARRHPELRLHVAERSLPAATAHVGTARRMLMDEAARRLERGGRPRGVIASTDADTRVGATWVAGILHEVACGADAVGGNIVADPRDWQRADDAALGFYTADQQYRRMLAALAAQLDPEVADPWPRHQHHTGASLAVTAASYRRVGGLPPLRSGEDVALVRALLRHDARVRHSPLVQVTTSARQLGRASGGMADTLQQWVGRARANGALLVPTAGAVAAQLRTRHELRRLWSHARWREPSRRATLRALAERSQIDPALLLDALGNASTFGGLLERLGATQAPVQTPVDEVSSVIADLRRRLASTGWNL